MTIARQPRKQDRVAGRGVDGQVLKRALLSSLSWLAAHQEEVNRLNVFPVPDGDTGTNMLLTLQAAVEDVRDSPALEVYKIAKVAAHGSLMGSRGNSGVILSQIFRGFGNAVQGESELTPQQLGRAFEEAANAAYRAVRNPTEGTILTVAREAGRAAVAAGGQPSATATSVMRAAATGAAEAVARTPSQLTVLREAGVVDAGGYGLQIMLQGMLESVAGSGPQAPLVPMASSSGEPPPGAAGMELPAEGWGYCTEFLIEGEKLDLNTIREQIEALGDSALVVGEEGLIKVHVHTDEPARVIALASGHGRLASLSVGDMSSQHRKLKTPPLRVADRVPAGGGGDRVARRNNGLGIVAVASGPGLAAILRGLGADAIVDGGQTMNPSTLDMVQAVDGVEYDHVVLLPNNKNVVLAASQVAELSRKQIEVLPTLTMPQGIAAMVAFSSELSATENLTAMRAASGHVQTIEVTRAVRDSRANGISVKAGQPIALVNDRLAKAGDDYQSVVMAALDQIGASRFELITVYRGEGASDSEADLMVAALRARFGQLTVEVQFGGQEHYPFIISVE